MEASRSGQPGRAGRGSRPFLIGNRATHPLADAVDPYGGRRYHRRADGDGPVTQAGSVPLSRSETVRFTVS